MNVVNKTIIALTAAAAGAIGPSAVVTADAISEKGAAAYATKAANASFGTYATNPKGDQLGWGESYILMGAVAMYEGTGQASHLQRVFDHADSIMANRADRINVRDDIRNKIVPAWPTGQYTNGVNYAWEVHAGMVTAPIARAAYLVRKDPALSATFGARADKDVRDMIDMAAGFEADWRFDAAKGEGHYNEFNLNGSPSPFNQSNALGRLYLNLYLATGQQRFKERATQLATYFKNRLRLAGAGSRYDWSYSPTNAATQSEDLSHAAINADFAFECYRAGIVFGATDMRRFVGTFMHMSNGSGRYYGTVAGTGSLYATPGLAGMWGHLGFVDPAVRTEFYKFYENNSSVGGVTWGSTIAGYLVETAKPMTMSTPVVRASEQKVVAGMEAGESFFPAGTPGPRSSNLAAPSTWSFDSGNLQLGRRSLLVTAIDDGTKLGGWSMEVPAGATMTLDRAGWVGLWMRTTSPGVSASFLVTDIDGLERSQPLPLTPDGQWHLYRWSLDDPAKWDALTGGDGTLEGLMVTLQSLLLTGPDASASVWVDSLTTDVNGVVPEPAAFASVVAGLSVLARRRR